MILSDGIHFNVPREVYDALDADNFSTIKHMRRSPRHYLAARSGGMKDTDAKKFGRAAHVAILEPHRFAEACVQWTGERRQGKAWEEFKAAHADREILTSGDWADCLGLTEAVKASAPAQTLLREGRAEVVCIWSKELVPGFSVRLKARIDWLGPNGAVDLKCVRDARQQAFGKDVVTYDLLAQAALYSDALEATTGERVPFYFVPGENAAPYCVRVYRVREDQIAAGRKTYTDWLLKLAWCREMDLWPDYDAGIEDLQLPAWADLSTEEEAEEVSP